MLRMSNYLKAWLAAILMTVFLINSYCIMKTRFYFKEIDETNIIPLKSLLFCKLFSSKQVITKYRGSEFLRLCYGMQLPKLY